MLKTLNWIDDNTLMFGDTKIALDYTHGGSPRVSRSNDFTMMKSKDFLDHYMKLAGGTYSRVLEVGLYQGGSFVFFDQILKPAKFSAVELSTERIQALDEYVATTGGRCKLYYGTSQDDVASLASIIEDDFGGELDLVLDDASHFYEPTRETFKLVFPKVRPGGLYIIEDWSWNFQDAFQGPDAPWKDQNALCNLVVDAMESMVLSPLIGSVEIHRQMIKIWRSDVKSGPDFLLKTMRRNRPSFLL